MRRMAVVLACLLALLVWSAAPVSADTIPAGTRSWSSATLGAESWYAGALPPPGFHFVDYTLYYHATHIKGQHGGEVTGAPFTDYEVSVYANVLRPLYVSKATILGASPAWHVVIPLVAQHQSSDFFSDTAYGVGDVCISPLILGWHRPPFHWAAGLDVIVPTGEYNKNSLTVIGHNHWTFEPVLAISYMPANGFSASTKLMYDIHTEDHALDYQEGDQFHLDYNVGYSWGAQREWKAGVCGYYLTSLEEDEQYGATIHGSKEKVFAIGPTFAYMKGPWFVELKAQKEMGAKNRPEGTAYWLKLIYSF